MVDKWGQMGTHPIFFDKGKVSHVEFFYAKYSENGEGIKGCVPNFH